MELGKRREIKIKIRIMGMQMSPSIGPIKSIQTCAFYANGVKLQSPASPSARWVPTAL